MCMLSDILLITTLLAWAQAHILACELVCVYTCANVGLEYSVHTYTQRYENELHTCLCTNTYTQTSTCVNMRHSPFVHTMQTACTHRNIETHVTRGLRSFFAAW
jgi:hypothetical protein